ncbi:hypothetical protein C8D92_104104 [Tamilnaduibacter salinus]|uniref:Uncharacterized protein n=1 Tax=Tamilnaduibacter salinus TaxID=1484056 RepID=A0A2U1CXK0_9GAMM|nr:hypothetical protein [Tamilnaduibacter salinus]PVY76873.1 hypothetical protein C8D92_104104 [Tamilnaduibacter salinus]
MDLSQLISFEGGRFLHVRLDQIEPVQGLPPSTIEALTAPVPALKSDGVLTSDAIRVGTILHPPLLWQPKLHEKRFLVIANLRTVEIARQLPAASRIPALVLSERLNQTSREQLLRISTFISTVWWGLDLSAANDSVLQQVQQLSTEQLNAIAPELTSRSGRERALGLNRRRRPADRRFARSPTSQQSLGLFAGGGDV